jgi:hypothetical protein
MARTTLQVPDFDFTGFYYGQILEDLVQYLRDNVADINTENPADPAVQLLRAFALVGHLNNVRLDMVAHEALFPTAQLRDSVVAHLKLIGFEVPGDVPATVTLLCKLSKLLTSTIDVVPVGALFGTKRTSAAEPLVFESDGVVTSTRTDQLSKVWVYDASGASYTDKTTEANTDALLWQALPATPAAGDILYIGHDSTLTNRLKVSGLTVAMAGITAVWEYNDGELEDAPPDSVANLGSTLKVRVDSMLDTDGSVSYAGLEVQVMLNTTGALEALVVTHDGSNNYVTTTGFLGQVSPSTTASDYTVGTYWHRVPGLDDATNDGNNSLELSGNIDFTVPKDADEDWNKSAVNAVTAYWLRLRVISVSGPVAPTIDRVYWHKRDNFVEVPCTQGRPRSESAVATADGSGSQAYTLAYTPVIPESIAVTVDAEEWTEVANFLSSNSVDQHYTLTVDSDGIGVILFGDGANGKAPTAGAVIAAVYRTDAEQDGNAAPRTLVVNRSGIANIKDTINPRSASGWVARRGSTATDLELLKLEGPASLRVLGRAVSPSDIEYLTVQWKDADGVRPFARAKVIEGFLGPKTSRIVTVGQAGALTSPTTRAALDVYFNGDPATGDSGVIVANQRVSSEDYTPVVIDITATVTGGNKEAIETALAGLIGPVALLDDGITYRWSFGATVSRNKIIATIFQADSDVSDVTLTLPAGNTALAADELPTLGTLTVTVV